MNSNVYRDHRVHVCASRCATCIFRPGNLMRLEAGRVKDLVQQAVGAGAGITCHDTLATDEQAICRGFWDGYRDEVQLLQIAERLEVVTYQPPNHVGETP